MADSDTVSVLRSELHNLRKLMKALKFEHKENVVEIQKKIDSITSGCQLGKISGSGSELLKTTATPGPPSSSGSVTFKPIGYVDSCHAAKNGSPRQPSVSPDSKGVIDISAMSKISDKLTNVEFSLENLTDFSHVWILFVFHLNPPDFCKTKVAPPRLGGKRVGIFSTRSPHRPNPIGLTLARIEDIQGTRITVSGLDLISGTPVLDLKPYIPRYDEVPRVIPPSESDDDVKTRFDPPQDGGSHEVKVADWIGDRPDLKVVFTQRAQSNLASFPCDKLVHLGDRESLRRAIVDILRADPRSNYRREKCSDKLYFFDVDGAHVTCWFDKDREQEIAEVLKVTSKSECI